MSEQRDYDNYLKGDYYPGAPKKPWRIAMEADFERRGISFDSRPVPQQRVAVKAYLAQKVRTGCRLKGRTNSEYMKDRRAKAIASGICADCYKEPAREGKTNCPECQAVRSAREMKRWKAKKLAQ